MFVRSADLIIAKAGRRVCWLLTWPTVDRIAFLTNPLSVRPLKAFLHRDRAAFVRSAICHDLQCRASRVRLGDARALPLKDASVDVVITSLPTSTASTTSGLLSFLSLMGHSVKDVRQIRSDNIGRKAGGWRQTRATGSAHALRAMELMIKCQ